MNFDRNAVQRLLALDDSQLTDMIKTIAASSGIDVSDKKFSGTELAKVRNLLNTASDEEIKRAMEQLQKLGKK